jgi:UDP-N-acetylmuramyl tripeptide synthase
VVAETAAPEGMASKWIQVKDVREARLEAAQIFYKDPFAKIAVHAVTGTNGKTTSAFLMDSMLTAAGHKVALLVPSRTRLVKILYRPRLRLRGSSTSLLLPPAR